jgi:hypothetical protein
VARRTLSADRHQSAFRRPPDRNISCHAGGGAVSLGYSARPGSAGSSRRSGRLSKWTVLLMCEILRLGLNAVALHSDKNTIDGVFDTWLGQTVALDGASGRYPPRLSGPGSRQDPSRLARRRDRRRHLQLATEATANDFLGAGIHPGSWTMHGYLPSWTTVPLTN